MSAMYRTRGVDSPWPLVDLRVVPGALPSKAVLKEQVHQKMLI